MTAAGEVLTVHRATADLSCRRCGCTIACGQRAALLAGVGAVHLRCILASRAAERPDRDPEETTLSGPGQQPEPESQATVAADAWEDAWPAEITPNPAPVADEQDVELAVKRGWDR